MDFAAGALAGLFIGGGAVGLVWALHCTRRQLRLWRKGALAEGRCTRAWTTSFQNNFGQRHQMPHHAIEFTTDDGRTIAFEEEDEPESLQEGEPVTVRYDRAAPERATARPPAVGLQFLLLGLQVCPCLLVCWLGYAVVVVHFDLP